MKILKKIIFFNILFITFAYSQEIKQEVKNEIKQEIINPKINYLNLDQAVDLAYKNKPDLKAAKFAIAASKETEKTYLAGYLPSITVADSPYLTSRQKNIQNTLTVQAQQLVYSFAGPLEQIKIQKKITDQAKLSEEELKDLIRFQVEISFLKSWLLQKKDTVIKNLNKTTKENFKKAENQNRLNLLDKNDWLKNSVTFAQDMSNVYLYTDELNLSQNELEYYIGKSFTDENEKTILVWDYKKDLNLKPVENYIELALKNRKELKIKQKEVEQYLEQEKFYKRSNSPIITLSGQSGITTIQDATRSFAENTVNLSISWNVFDGTANMHKEYQTHAQMMKASLEKSSEIQKVRFEVIKTYNELISLLKQFVAKNLEYTQAKNEFKLKKQQFEIGDIAKIDFDQAVYNWQNKKFSWLTAKVNIAQKERELYYDCGYPVIG